MSKIHFYLATWGLLLFFCCKQAPEAVSTSPTETISFPLNATKGGSYASMDLIRNQAGALIDARIKDSNDPLAIITAGFWNPEFVFNDKMSEPNEYDGYWLDFKEDYTYEYGYFEDLLGSGRYYFRLDDKSLIMMDDNADYEPKVWTALYNGRAMALQGSHELGINNGMQVKLISIDSKPVKK